MENKSSPIDKIKVLENSVNELKSIINNFINKKLSGEQFHPLKVILGYL